MLRKFVLGIAVAVFAVAGAAVYAKGPSGKECRQVCEAGINACMNSCGETYGTTKAFRRKCKKAIVKRCRQEGTAFCQQLLPPTTTPTTPGTTTTTLPRFVDNGDGTISDNDTGLMWEKKSNDGSIHDMDNRYTWSSFQSEEPDGTAFTEFLPMLNAGSGFAGYTDWRIPEIDKDKGTEELDALLDESKEESPHTYVEFNSSCTEGCTLLTCSCTNDWLYWTATVYKKHNEDAWAIDFGSGHEVVEGKDNALYVRAVRGGE